MGTEAYTGYGGSRPYALYACTVTEQFDPRGQPRRTRQYDSDPLTHDENTVVEIVYDSLGRKTRLRDPDRWLQDTHPRGVTTRERIQ